MVCPNCPTGKLTYYGGAEYNDYNVITRPREKSFWFCGICGHRNNHIGLSLGIYYSIGFIKVEEVPIIKDLVQMFA